MLSSTVERSGDILTTSRCAEGEMPGALLDTLGFCPQPLVHFPALIKRHLGVQDRSQERMSKPQHVTVALDDACVDCLVDGDPGLPVTAGRADQSLARVRGSSNQPAHPPRISRQLAQTTSYKTSEALRNGDGLVAEHTRMLKERTCALERIEGIPATPFIQPREGIPGQYGSQS